MDPKQTNLILAYSRGFIQFLDAKQTTYNRYYEEGKTLLMLFQTHPRWLIKLHQLHNNRQQKVIKNLFNPPFAAGWNKLFTLLFDDGNWWLVEAILKQIKNLLATQLKIQTGKVYSVIRLTIKQITALTTALTKRFHKRIELENYLDQHLIGGVVLELGDQYFDNSLATQLKNFQLWFKQEAKNEN